MEGQPLIAAKALPDARPGDTVSGAIRPEGVALGEGRPGANRLSESIDESSFLGSIIRLRVSLGEASISLDTFNDPNLTLPEHGATVVVNLPREACLVLSVTRRRPRRRSRPSPSESAPVRPSLTAAPRIPII
ncbi:MAG: TOBE domain-containing protein [Chloroflexi bacterium]|nr:TOBE domain-containing protein [Chloroflexota bacterium]